MGKRYQIQTNSDTMQSFIGYPQSLASHYGCYFHSLNKQLLALYRVLGTAVGAQDKAVNKTDTVLNVLRKKAIHQEMSKVIAEGDK